MSKQIPFIDLQAQQDRIRPQIDAAIKRVLDHGNYIMGPEVFELEEQLAHYCGARHAITCSSGTDALLMVLMAKGVGPGDAVFIPSFTFTATPEVVALLGATPIFVDVLPNTYNIDPKSVEQGVEAAKKQGLKPKAIIAVDLFGQPADYSALEKVAHEHDLWVLADAAQSFGATLQGKKVGTLALATATSFFPAKPLGCYGDGGAVFTDDDELAEILKSIRVHGKGKHKYDNVRIGLNARIDTIQAAILLEKLKIFDDELKERQQIAKHYNEALKDVVQTPHIIEGATSAWAQYTVKLKQDIDRSKIMHDLKEKGIPTMVYYEKPLHLQEAYKGFPKAGELTVSEECSRKVLSLPISNICKIQIVQKIKMSLRE
ncbi:MAG: DegT/DnrJ/EryC1/StrS family aminotransferase [Alphaproteobacteria bacterium]|nr:MAG: DegT/DnrJ/EryC1/StrS family aminotransferase [Alphaproteobacteria bacterium]